MLYVELVPKTCWKSNLRDHLSTQQWDFIRRQVYAKAQYTCQICGARNVKLECHEVWKYTKNNVQQLIGLAALCQLCHAAKHIGYAKHAGKYHHAIRHMMQINGWSRRQVEQHVEAAIEIAVERGKHSWQLDLSWLTANYGIYVKSKR